MVNPGEWSSSGKKPTCRQGRRLFFRANPITGAGQGGELLRECFFKKPYPGEKTPLRYNSFLSQEIKNSGRVFFGMVQLWVTEEGERFAIGGSRRPFCKGFANRFF